VSTEKRPEKIKNFVSQLIETRRLALSKKIIITHIDNEFNFFG